MEVKEARERVRSAIQNAGLEFPSNKRITVRRPTCPRIPAASTCRSRSASWRPAARSSGTRLAGHEFAGELSLSGKLRPVRGALAMALAVHVQRIATRLVLPTDSAGEAALVPGAEVYGARHLLDVVRQFVPHDRAAAAPSRPATAGSRMQPRPPGERGPMPTWPT